MKKFFLLFFAVAGISLGTHAQVDNYALKLSSQGNVNFHAMPELNTLSSFTVQFWINPTQWVSGATIYSRGEDFSAKLGEQGNIIFIVGNQTITASSTGLIPGKWSQISFFCNNGTPQIYINNLLVYDNLTTLSPIPQSNDDFIIGGGFTGRIDEFRLWNTLLPMDYNYFRCNTLNKWVPQWDNLIAYYKFDQNLCENIVDYKFKHHGVMAPGAERAIVTDNEEFKYRVAAAYTSFSRFFDRAIDKDKYLLANDLIVLGVNSKNDGTLYISYPNNQGTVTNGGYLAEYNGRSGVLSLNGTGAKMEVGSGAMNPTDKYTLETWIYLEEWTEGAFIFKKETPDGSQGISIRLGTADKNQVIVRVNGHDYVNQRRLTTGKWIHFGVSTFSQDLTIEETFLFTYNGAGYFGATGLCGSVKESWVPKGVENISATIGENLKAKFDETVIWHSNKDANGIKADMSSLPVPGFDKVLTADIMNAGNSFWNYDRPENVGYDTYSYTNYLNIMRSAYDGYRGFHIRMSVSGHDGWENTFADANKRVIFAQNLARIANEFDGVDLDFEWCYTQTCWDNYGKLLLEIDKLLGKDKIFSVSPHYVSYGLRPMYMDRVNYFTFQIYGPAKNNFLWSTYLDAYNRFTTQGYPKDKMVMSFATTTSNSYDASDNKLSIAPTGVRNGLLDGNYTPDMDKVMDAQGNYRYITGYNQTYNRCNLVNEKNLAGIMYWDMGNDVKTSHKYSLVKASSFGINSNVDTLVTKVDVTPTAITYIKKEPGKISIFPNPVKETLFFQLLGDAEPHRIQVFNTNGLCVISKEQKENELSIDSLPCGSYILRVLTSNGETYKNTFFKN